MSDDQIERIRYYNGQLLTKQDFEDEQNYHIKKLKHHAKRFPPGVIAGLEVKYDTESEKFKIVMEQQEQEVGSAVTKDGEQIIVNEELSIDQTKYSSDKPYLYIKFHEDKVISAGNSICNNDNKKNRIVECAELGWSEIPDSEGTTITLAWIEEADRSSCGQTKCKKYNECEETYCIHPSQTGIIKDRMGRRVRLDAKIFDEENIVFTEGGHDHIGSDKGKQIGTNGIALYDPQSPDPTGIIAGHIQPNAVTFGKLDSDLQYTIENGFKNVTIDATSVGDLKGTYPDHVYIKPHKVTTEKIAAAVIKIAPDYEVLDGKGIQSNQIRLADGSHVYDPSFEDGIKTAHIFDDAITSNKIAEAGTRTEDGEECGIQSAHIRLPDPDSLVTNPSDGDGIKTAHIFDDAVTGDKIAKAGGSPDLGINSEHIQENAILSKHIEYAETTDIPETESGIKTEHIQDGAVTGDKIAIAGGSPDDGINTEHIQNGAVTLEKLHQEVLDEIFPTSPPSSSQSEPLSESYYIPELSTSTIKSQNIGQADEGISGQDITTGSGIKTAHIQNEAVTSAKLSLIEAEANGTIAAGDTVEVSFDFEGADFDKPRIGQVIPIKSQSPGTALDKGLSFNMEYILLSENKIRYKFTITNHSPFVIQYKRRIIKFN